jgi:hypothetical protein
MQLVEGEAPKLDPITEAGSGVIKGKLLESERLRQQATNNTKEQFANSPDLRTELLNAIMGALDAHTAMSTQALNSSHVQQGLKDVLLNMPGCMRACAIRAEARDASGGSPLAPDPDRNGTGWRHGWTGRTA